MSELIATIRAALRGGEHDFTEGSLDRAIVLLAIPMVLEMAMESLFAIVDVFWVSRLGADAVAAVGITESLIAIIYAIGMGLSMAATATVARRIGERKPEEAAAAAGQSVTLGVLISIPIAVFGALYAAPLLRVMGASDEVVRVGTGYTALALGSNVIILLLFLINAAFRGAGDAAVAMRVLWFSNALNIVLGPIFIFVLKMGVLGAAVATTVGRGLGVLLQLHLLLGGTGRLQVRARHLIPSFAALSSLFRIGVGGTVQSIIGTASWIGLVRILAPFGAAALAGYTIGMRVIMFAILPSWGLSNAAATLVGQSLGAKKPERAEAAVARAGWWNTFVLLGVGVIFVLLADPIAGAFTKEPEVRRMAASSLRIVAFGFPFYGFGMVFGNAFNGAGDTRTPTILNLLCFWAIELPLAWFLASRFGPRGAFASIAVAFSLLAVFSGIVFKRGAWKRIQV
ncbi:MAG: MATE family efflux transporter [Polyangiales bacterium]